MGIMATTASLRSRRNAAQLHALEGVEREIHSSDHNSRRKYLQDYIRAFRSYDSVIGAVELNSFVRSADVVLVGDYHALPASQRFAASLFEQRAHGGDRPVVLGIETVVARDQHILDEWWRREIDEAELRQRIRFDQEWGYDWQPFYDLLITGREHGEGLYGLDCVPRNDLRKIGARDRHAAHKIAEIRQRHPNAVIVVLFGESHLAPNHLPRLLHQQLSEQRVVTVLQNVDALYWGAAGEKHEQVNSVRIDEDTICVFNATPVEKYENYRMHLARWAQEESENSDLTPTIHNLIDSLVTFAGINRYSSHNGTQPKFLIDLLPEVHSETSEADLQRLLSRLSGSDQDTTTLLTRLEERGSIYLPQINAFYVRDFQLKYAAEEAARFLHHACRGLPRYAATRPRQWDKSDEFYARSIEHALAYFGSRVLYPARPTSDDLGEVSPTVCRQSLKSALRGDFEAIAEDLGYRLGGELYADYLAGKLSRGAVRRLLLTHLEEAGTARKLCLKISTADRSRRKKPSSSAGAFSNQRQVL